MESDNQLKENENNTLEDTQARLAEELQTSIAKKVRADSEYTAKLTSIDSLRTLQPDLEFDCFKNKLAEMAEKDDFKDIQTVIAPNGIAFLYSTAFMTKQYANILATIESDDKSLLIATTVRDDSRIYPRLTKLEFFMAPPFSMKPDGLEVHINKTIENEEYKDIKILVASTGARYLYSNLYINDSYAKTIAEWEEVEQFENP
ncbi:MAG: hypothetical protein JSV74_00310 [Dehalococcoidia bacterium]|nr:MAG: hypothetical protein JSV74_00310 [Dehalococcoidia bacterium]